MNKKHLISISDFNRLQQHRSGLFADSWFKLLHSTDRNKLKKLLKLTFESHPRLSKFCAKTNLLDLKVQQIQEIMRKADEYVALGLVELFDRIQELRMKELQKQNAKMQDEILYYANKKNNQHVSKSGVASITLWEHNDQQQKPRLVWNSIRLSQELSSFEQKHGKMWLVNKRSRLLCDLIDRTYQKITEVRSKNT